MDRAKEVRLAEEWYNQGYKDGFTDACNLVGHTLSGLKASAEKKLDGHTIVVDKEGE